ncbi:unnamed protein product [Triticum turgidum subsp. durum]|uniref:RRM domain-containing protein n=1 Tax=Triticum turgidum subsp. durum TaxID=4567 RepID=A0A9R1NU52_TRITD|nr:unnamed protein product [Triticum turgidum subsp. durum]
MAAAENAGDVAAGESRKLFVGGIPSSAQETELRGHFARFGAVRSIVVMRDKESGHGRGFGFVEFEDEEAAAKALGDGERPKHFICGRLVDVKRARARPPRNLGEQPVHQHQHQLERGPVGFDDSTYQPYNNRHGFYNGYMPQPVPTHPYYHGLYFGMGGNPYANAYPNHAVMANVPNMVARRPVYSPYPPMYPGYGFAYRSGYAGAAPSVQYGVNGGRDYMNDQDSMDVQELDSTATIATKFEYMKLGSQ